MINVIVNPNSCCGKGRRIWKKIECIFAQSQLSYQVFFTEHKGHATEIAMELTKIRNNDYSEKVIIIVGGDGTVNEVINGIVFERQVKLGYIPTGSGNDFARSLRKAGKEKKSPGQMAEYILHSQDAEWIDYGVILAEAEQVTTRRFAVSSGIGMDAAVCYDVLDSALKNLLNKYHLSKISYLIIGAKQLAKMSTTDAVLRLDGGMKIPLKKVSFVSFHIHPFEGGGFKFAPKAEYSDGLLDICVVSERGRLQMIPVLLRALFGRSLCMRGVRSFRCKEANLELNEPKKVHADGEAFGRQKNITVRCIGKRIRLIR